MILVDPSIDPAVAALAPGFRALSITVAAAPITNPDVGALALAQACRALGEDVPRAERIFRLVRCFHAVWCQAQAYALFRRRLAQARAARWLDAQHRSGGRSLQRRQHSLCGAGGGENIAAYVGEPRLIVADGSELFDTVKEGAVIHESPEAGRWFGATIAA